MKFAVTPLVLAHLSLSDLSIIMPQCAYGAFNQKHVAEVECSEGRFSKSRCRTGYLSSRKSNSDVMNTRSYVRSSKKIRVGQKIWSQSGYLLANILLDAFAPTHANNSWRLWHPDDGKCFSCCRRRSSFDATCFGDSLQFHQFRPLGAEP